MNEQRSSDDWMDSPCPVCGKRMGEHKTVPGWIGRGCPDAPLSSKTGVDLQVEIQKCYSCAPLPELVVLTLAACDDEIERLRKALHQIACGDWFGVGPTPKDAVYAQDIARAALDGQQSETTGEQK